MQTAGDSRLGTIVENFRLLSVLGAGSMSVVYLAQRIDDPRVLVAVKILHDQGLSSPEDHAAFRARFQREARAASKLRNEYILPVLSSGEAGDLPYMVMPVIVGGTLTARLANQPQPMPLSEIARYLSQLAIAVDYAHEQGVVHRDIKPSNILLDEHGHVYLTDFGIARLFDSGDNALTRESAPTLTRTGQVLGTPYYMAPEQIQARPVGPSADIYALGVVLYQMVTGQVPFHGDTPLAIALQHLQEAPNSPGLLRSALPAPLDAVILRSLAKNPAERFTSAAEMSDAFQAGFSDLDDPMATRPPSETWPFSTRFASGGALPATPPSTPVPQTRDLPEKFVGQTLDGYHLGAVIESDDLGTVFMAHRDGSSDLHWIRFLTLPPDATPKRVASYLLRFEQQAHELAALSHPNLAPLVSYGAYEGWPYLVTPDNQGATLGAELAQHGAAELSAIGACLDQIVAGLEYAHKRGILHLSLSADRVYRQDDGKVIVTDVGVRGMLDQEPGAEDEPPALSVSSDANAPEQLVGAPVGPYTDVYAVGALLYYMLTGREVFIGATRDEVAQQHLHSTVPPLRRWRPSLPSALDRVISRAMAKEPERRFQTLRELVGAYHAAVAHTQPDTSLVVAPAYSTLRHVSATSINAGSASAASLEPVTPDARPARASASSGPQATIGAGSSAGSTAPTTSPGRAAPPPTRPLPPTARPGWDRRVVGAAVAVVLIVSLIAGAFFLNNNQHQTAQGPGPLAANALATATFFDNTAHETYNSDAFNLQVTALPTPQAGYWYEAWLIDDQSEHVLPLGKLVLQSGQSAQGNSKAYTLGYVGNGSPGHPDVNLLGFGNRIKITYESQIGNLPSGPVVMEGAFPPQAFVHIRHLLVAFPTTPQKVGLLVGMIEQMNLLYQQANVLQQWISLHYPKSTLCAAQSVIDIIEGQSGAHYKLPGPECNVGQVWPSGDTYGLLGTSGYLAGVADHAALAASAPDASPHIRLHSGHVQIAVANITGWLQTVDQDAISVLAGTSTPNTAPEIVHLSQVALIGQDTNNDETVDPVPGEAGANLAYTHGQLLALLTFGPSH